ncbi:hypothetical protein HPB48_013146 [Haemaphysalis longicornis]|uniref:Uncharacterized protein n=1 Tax=Haemaphysalis longicornis TaxID=44386 RepID=A0A9J6G7H6_HAELO|nr:hypothetical protein HPB48_013146 [Haemaphysalis longicornis]
MEYRDNRDLRRPARQRPLRLPSIRLSPNRTIPVTAHQTPGKGMCRGVIHQIDPSETAQSLRRALYSESHHCRTADGEARSLPRVVRGNQTATDDQVLECTHEGFRVRSAKSGLPELSRPRTQERHLPAP